MQDKVQAQEKLPPEPPAKPGETFKGEVPAGCLDPTCEVVEDHASEDAIEGRLTPGPGVGAD